MKKDEITRAAKKKAEAQRRFYAAHPERVREMQRRYKARDPEKWRAVQRKADAKRYGIPEPTRSMPNCCEGCGVAKGPRAFDRDHNHKNGQFRGWLCNLCNRVLGLFEDDPQRLELLAAYLRRTTKGTFS